MFRSLTNEHRACPVKANGALELFKRRYKQDVGVASRVSRTGLKVILAKYDATIGSDILKDRLQRQDAFFLYAPLPKFALNDPAAFDSMLTKCYIHVDRVRCASTGYPGFDTGRAAAFSKECGHGLLIVSPIPIDRIHCISVPG